MSEEDRKEERIYVHVYHYFPDRLEVDLSVTMEQVPTALGLVPGTPVPTEGDDSNG
jgi:hypothetical protein